MVGVLSAANVPSKRDIVRETWAHNRTNVFFLVAGNWTDEIRKEFGSHHDLIWVDAPEIYRGVTEKVQVLFHAVHTHLPDYNYIMKTDDDSHVRLEALEQKALTFRSNYLYSGDCQHNWVIRDPNHFRYVSESVYDNGGDKFYPIYAVGAGYVLAKDLVACVMGKMQVRRSFPVEDASTGVHVHRCNGSCTATKGLFHNDFEPKAVGGSYLVMHLVPNERVMRQLHRKSCCSSRVIPDQKSCSPTVCSDG